MEKDTKVKIIIGACFAIFILLLVLGVVYSNKKKGTKTDETEEVSLRAERKNDFTTEDMMKANENKNSYESNSGSSYENKPVSASSTSSTTQSSVPSYQGSSSEVDALQKQLRDNKKAQAEEEATPVEPAPTAPRHTKPKVAKATKTEEVYEAPKVEPVAVVAAPAPVAKINPNGRSRNLSGPTQVHSPNMINAVIHNDQVITSGAKVKLRITQSIVVDGVTIPSNSFVYGIATFSKTRMSVSLQSIIVGSTILPFNKTVYDKDGMQGIYLPDNVKSEDANEAGSEMTDQALGTVNTGGILGAALNTGKSLIRKKAQRQTVTLKSNYKLFLK